MFLSGTQKKMSRGGGGQCFLFNRDRGAETVNSSQKRKTTLQTKQSVSTSREECRRKCPFCSRYRVRAGGGGDMEKSASLTTAYNGETGQ